MKQSILKLVCINVVIITMSLSICGHSDRSLSSRARPNTANERVDTIFVFHTDEFWLNLHHFLYVLARAENKERDASREAVGGAPADQDRGLGSLSEKDRAVWREAVA